MIKSKFERLAAINAASRARLGRAAVGVVALAGSVASHATGFTVDAAPIVDTISAAVTTVSALGMAVLSLVVVIKLFKWMQRVL